jgi:small subunit ribosomal protein S16
MAVVLRLRQEGAKGRPFYRIVAADKRFKRDGRFLEVLGHYNPSQQKDNSFVDLAKVDAWIANGAKPTETVGSIIRRARTAAK